jgi:PPOX class probable F420-dependent enzyme
MNIDLSTDFGKRVQHHLDHDQIVWLTVIDDEGAPQPNPIWFVWDGETFLFYSRPEAKRLLHFPRRPAVSLHFDTDSWGDDVAVIRGEAAIDPSAPPVIECPPYLEKYAEGIIHIEMTPQTYSETYTVAFRVRPSKLRGYYVPPGESPSV